MIVYVEDDDDAEPCLYCGNLTFMWVEVRRMGRSKWGDVLWRHHGIMCMECCLWSYEMKLYLCQVFNAALDDGSELLEEGAMENGVRCLEERES